MSEKEIKDIKEQVETRYDKKLKKREEMKVKEAKEKKLISLVTIIIVLVCVVGIGALLVNKYQQTHGTYIVVDGDEISKATFDYYFQVAYNNYQNMYGTYIGYLGLDVTADLYEQEYSEDMSWGDFFEQLAVDYIVESKALTKEAEAVGFEYDVEAEYNTFVESIESAATEAGVTVSNYYKAVYGEYASASSVKPMIEESILYSAYYNEKYDTFEPTDEEITAYYNENSTTYDTVGYNLYTISAEYETAEGEAVSDEVLAEAMEEALEKAETFAQRVEEGEEFYVVAQDYAGEDEVIEDATSLYVETENIINVNGAYSFWLFEDTRIAGEITTAVDEINSRYFVIQYDDRYLDDAPSASVRFVQTTTVDGATILQEWEDAGATEEAFIELVHTYSEGDTSNDGLIENITSDSVLEDIQDWIFDETRAISDTTSITADNGYTYVLYYVGTGKEQWKITIEYELISTLMYDYVESIKANISVEDPDQNLKYLQISSATDDTITDDTTVE